MPKGEKSFGLFGEIAVSGLRSCVLRSQRRGYGSCMRPSQHQQEALKNLEEEYKIRIFERSSTGMIPTEQGRRSSNRPSGCWKMD